MNGPWKIIGLMSGTSVDTLDVVLIELSGTNAPPKLLEFREYEYPSDLRNELVRLANTAHKGNTSLDDLSRLNAYLGFYYGEKVLHFLKETGHFPKDIDLIGSHGQTVSHTPNRAFLKVSDPFTSAPASLQIGDGDCIAKTTGITTVTDFRMGDIASGGEGAPLCPAGHQLFFGRSDRRTVIVNLGGICNITCLRGEKSEETVAFDTGPANMVLDGLITKLSNGRETFDKNGETARRGTCNDALLQELLEDPYFKLPAPKSCGRTEFGEPFIDLLLREMRKRELSQEDILRTATELTAVSLRNAVRKQGGMSLEKDDLVVCMGGGTRNIFLMERIAEELSPATVQSSDAMGINAGAFEAVCFGWFSYLCVTGQPFPLPEITGASTGSIYGKISPGEPGRYRQLLKKVTGED